MSEAGTYIDGLAPAPSPAKEGTWDIAAAGLGSTEGMRVVHRVFIRRLEDDRYLAVYETYAQEHELLVHDGLRQIRRSATARRETPERLP